MNLNSTSASWTASSRPSKNLRAGNISYASIDLEEVKKLINKRNKLARFANKSPAGWTAVEKYESDELADHSEDEKKASFSREQGAVKDP